MKPSLPQTGPSCDLRLPGMRKMRVLIELPMEILHSPSVVQNDRIKTSGMFFCCNSASSVILSLFCHRGAFVTVILSETKDLRWAIKHISWGQTLIMQRFFTIVQNDKARVEFVGDSSLSFRMTMGKADSLRDSSFYSESQFGDSRNVIPARTGRGGEWFG